LPKDREIASVYQFVMKKSWTTLGRRKYTQPTMKSFSPTDPTSNSHGPAIGLSAQTNQGPSGSVSGRVLDVGDLAEIFKCSREKIKRMARRGDLPAFKFGKHWFVRQDDLERFLANQVQSGCHLRRDQENRE
jgi:excisionase family DNA binding protein